MNIVTRHIFKKHGIFLLFLMFVFFCVKLYSVENVASNRQNDTYLKEWISQMYDMDMLEREDYINTLVNEVYQSESSDSERARQVSQLYSMNRSLKESCYLIDFAKNGEGILPNVLPLNYLELLGFYAEMEYPRLIYDVSLEEFFSLQMYNIVPFITFFVFAIFFANQYETQVYTYTLTTKNGKLYNKKLKNVLLLLCLVLFIANEMFDVMYSGVLFDKQLLEAPLQSYDSFSNVQMHSTIGAILFWSMLSKLLGILIVSQIAELLAIKMKNIKDVAIGGMFFFLFCSLLTISFNSSKFLSCIQIGAVDWKSVISESTYCVPLHMSYFTLGLCITGMLLLMNLLIMRWEQLFKKNYEW